MDATLLHKFEEAVQSIHPAATTKVVNNVHGILVTKIYHARSNEFLRTISRIECLKQRKAVDVNISLRDKLKSYASEKQSQCTI